MHFHQLLYESFTYILGLLSLSCFNIYFKIELKETLDQNCIKYKLNYNHKIMTETNIFIITVCSCISSILFCFCFKYCKDRHRQIHEQNKLNNVRQKVASKLRVKPIIQITDDPNVDELKDEFELRNVEPTGDQNV